MMDSKLISKKSCWWNKAEIVEQNKAFELGCTKT
jgi:hypothetical protein